MFTVEDMSADMVLHASLRAQKHQLFAQLPKRFREFMKNGTVQQRPEALWLLDELELKHRQQQVQCLPVVKFMSQEVQEAVSTEITSKTPLWRRRKIQASLAKLERFAASIELEKKSRCRPKAVAAAV